MKHSSGTVVCVPSRQVASKITNMVSLACCGVTTSLPSGLFRMQLCGRDKVIQEPADHGGDRMQR